MQLNALCGTDATRCQSTAVRIYNNVPIQHSIYKKDYAQCGLISPCRHRANTQSIHKHTYADSSKQQQRAETAAATERNAHKNAPHLDSLVQKGQSRVLLLLMLPLLLLASKREIPIHQTTTTTTQRHDHNRRLACVACGVHAREGIAQAATQATAPNE